MMREWIVAAGIGFVLDCMVGDPEGWYHPVRSIGFCIGWMESALRRLFPPTARGELAGGTVLAVAVPVAAAAVAAGLLALAGLVHPWLRFAMMCVMSWQILAAKSLKDESMKVCQALKAGDTEAARGYVSRIVGRDTENLSREGIIRAAVETVAENASDGVVAPFCWTLLLGPAGGWFYKAVNTMDSMVGYRNERYEYFGKAAARLDDGVNWIPARLTALLFVAAAWLLPGMDGREAWRIWLRDRRNHKSPNSAQSEAACAGALGVELAGDAWYFGVLHRKPLIGQGRRPIEPEDIGRANRLMYTAAVLMWAAGTGGMLWVNRYMEAIFTGM